MSQTVIVRTMPAPMATTGLMAILESSGGEQ